MSCSKNNNKLIAGDTFARVYAPRSPLLRDLNNQALDASLFTITASLSLNSKPITCVLSAGWQDVAKQSFYVRSTDTTALPKGVTLALNIVMQEPTTGQKHSYIDSVEVASA